MWPAVRGRGGRVFPRHVLRTWEQCVVASGTPAEVWTLLLLQGWAGLVPLPDPETMLDALEKEGKDKTFLLGPSPPPPPSSVVLWTPFHVFLLWGSGGMQR